MAQLVIFPAFHYRGLYLLQLDPNPSRLNSYLLSVRSILILFSRLLLGLLIDGPFEVYGLHAFLIKSKKKAMLVTGPGGLYGSETSRVPHFLDSWLTDGGQVISFTRRPRFSPRRIFWYLFLLEAE
jgi:hypothetical protein